METQGNATAGWSEDGGAGRACFVAQLPLQSLLAAASDAPHCADVHLLQLLADVPAHPWQLIHCQLHQVPVCL